MDTQKYGNKEWLSIQKASLKLLVTCNLKNPCQQLKLK